MFSISTSFCVTCIADLIRCPWARWRLRYNGVIVMIEIRAAEALF
eukprot:COSAG06_NODE_41151_length_394_cov_0.959322_2_plen_44_part_01